MAAQQQQGPQQGQVSLDDLSLEQLGQVKQQLEEELQHLASSFRQLSEAQAKFKACMEAIDSVKSANKDKKILIPLTSSLYVPGKLVDTDNVIVDVGTGYFVEKPTRAAKTLYNSKILSLRSTLSQLQQQVELKENNHQAVGQVIQARMAHQRRLQQQQQAGQQGATEGS